jgi:hypothetical protein
VSEEGNENVDEGVVQPTETEQGHDDAQTEAQVAADQKRNDEEKNWEEVRRKMREQQQLIEESQKKIQELTAPKSPKEEENWGIDDDDLAEGKHIKELKKELKALQKDLKSREVEAVQERVQTKFPDYESVVSQENIETLKKIKPGLAKALSRFDNPYELAVEAYDLIKTYVVKEPSGPSLEAKKVEENSSKPRSAQAISKTSALADVNQFSEMDAKGRKAFLKSKFDEMQRAVKGF